MAGPGQKNHGLGKGGVANVDLRETFAVSGQYYENKCPNGESDH